MSTDHRIVTAKIRLSLRKNDKRTATTKQYDGTLLNNKDVRDKYVLELRNRFETLQEKTEKSTPNDEYENFVNAHLEAAAKYIPTKIKTKYRVPWETLAVREKRALVKTASKNYRKNPTNTNALKLKTAQYQLAGIYIKEQTEYIQNQIDKIRDSVEDRQSRIAWQTINEVSRRKNTAKAKLKAANQQERIKLWKQHFENLLGNPPKITPEPITRIISKQLDIKLGPFTQEELDSVLRKIKNRLCIYQDGLWVVHIPGRIMGCACTRTDYGLCMYQDGLWVVHVPFVFTRMAKFKLLTQFLVDDCSHPIMFPLQLTWRQFATVTYYAIDRCHYYYHFHYYFTHLRVFHWSLNDSKSHQVSRTLLRILANFNNSLVWMVSTPVLISNSSHLCTYTLETVPSDPNKIGITVTFMSHSFF